MRCEECGKEIESGAVFCPFCGKKVVRQKEPRQSKACFVWGLVSSAIAIMLAIALVLVLTSANPEAAVQDSIFSGQTAESSDEAVSYSTTPSDNTVFYGQEFYSSPEQAAEFFTESIAKNDFSAALSAFAIKKRAENYDFKTTVGRLSAFSPYSSLAPDYEAYTVLNEADLANDAAMQVKWFVYSFFYDAPDDSQWQTFDDSDQIAALYETLDPAVLSSLKLVRIDRILPSSQNAEGYEASIQSSNLSYGSTDLQEYFALYEWNGTCYYGGFQFAQYSDGWQIVMLNSILGGTSIYGDVTETSMEAYLALLNS